MRRLTNEDRKELQHLLTMISIARKPDMLNWPLVQEKAGKFAKML